MSLAKIPDAVLPTTPEHRVESTAVKVPPLKVRAPKIIFCVLFTKEGKEDTGNYKSRMHKQNEFT